MEPRSKMHRKFTLKFDVQSCNHHLHVFLDYNKMHSSRIQLTASME